MTTTFRAKGPADLLSAIPTMAGYTPTDSVVLVPFSGKTSIGLFRLDLPTIDHTQFAATSIGMVCKLEEATGVMVVVFAQESPATPSDNPFSSLGTAFLRAAQAAGLDVGDCIYVFRDGWFSQGETQLREHDSVGEPPEVDAPPPLANQLSGTRLPHVSRERTLAFRSAFSAFESHIKDMSEHQPPIDEHSPTDDIHAIIEAGAVSVRGTVEEDAALLWVMSRPVLRDVALSQWCYGTKVATKTLRNQLNWLDGIPYPCDDLFLMGEGAVPDAGRLMTALDRLRYIAAEASGRSKAGAFAGAAWISWALGNSTHAAYYAGRALKAQPQHGLSQIILTIVNAGMLPEWGFKQRSVGQRKRAGR